MNNMKTKLFAFTATLALALTACDSTPHYDANTMAAIQPCMSMGFQPAQCMAAYQQAGRPQSTDTNWLGTVAAFAAGAAANHWWNRNDVNDYRQYQFRPDYMNQPDYYDRNYNTPQRRTWVTPQVQGIPQGNQSIPQLVPEKNTTVIIPGQKAQPLFANPTNIAPNQVVAKPPVVVAPITTTAPGFKPIQVVPPTTTTNATPTTTFKPIQLAPPTPAPAKKSWSLFGGSSTTTTSTPKPTPTTAASKPATSTFKPIRVAPPSKSYSSSSTKRK